MANQGNEGRTLGELAEHVRGEVIGDPAVVIVGVNSLEGAGLGEIAFYKSRKHAAAFASTGAAAVIVSREATAESLPRDVASRSLPLLRVNDPQLAWARISQLFNPRPTASSGIRRGAHVHEEAEIDPHATVMAGATVERRARIGARTVLFPGVYIGESAVIGSDCLIYPNVTVRERCVIGSRVTLHPSCVIGADGFGYVVDRDTGEQVAIPQIGIVRIQDDVEIGACSCVDRATVGETLIERGVKIDNLVQIAHNVKVERGAILCAQVGVAGSSSIGRGAILTGQVGVNDHVRVGEGAVCLTSCGVVQSIADNAHVSGTPAFDHTAWLRASALFRQLPSLVKRWRSFEKRLAQLELGREP